MTACVIYMFLFLDTNTYNMTVNIQ